MKKAKRIKEGVCKGLIEISAEMLQRKEKRAKAQETIPVKKMDVIEMGVKFTPEYCLQDMETCPAPCGACLYEPNVGSLYGTRLSVHETLDMEKYQKQSHRN